MLMKKQIIFLICLSLETNVDEKANDFLDILVFDGAWAMEASVTRMPKTLRKSFVFFEHFEFWVIFENMAKAQFELGFCQLFAKIDSKSTEMEVISMSM